MALTCSSKSEKDRDGLEIKQLNLGTIAKTMPIGWWNKMLVWFDTWTRL